MAPSNFEQSSRIHEIATTSIKEQLETLQFSAPSKNELSHLLTKTANSVEASHTNQDNPELSRKDELSHLSQSARNSIEEYLPIKDLAGLMQTSKNNNNVLFGNTQRGQKLKEANQLARGPFTFPTLSTKSLWCLLPSFLSAGGAACFGGGAFGVLGGVACGASGALAMGIFGASVAGGGCLSVAHCADVDRSEHEGERNWYQNVDKDFRDHHNNLDNNINHVRIKELRAELKQL